MADDNLGFVEKTQDDGLGFKPKSSPEKSGILQDILQAGGTAGRAIGYGIGDVLNVPIEAANYANQKVAGLFGVKPENVPTPQPFNPQAFPMPEVSQQRQQELDPLARGLATGAELATPATDLAKLVSTGGKKLLSTLQNKLGLAANQKAKSFMNDLLQGNSVSEATKPVADEIRNKYTAAKSDFNNQYSAIKSEAADRGYAPTVAKQFPGISVATDEKSIIPNNFESVLDKIDLSKHSNDINEAIDDFKENPSFEKAHDLQSTLGSEGDKLRSNKDSDNRKLGGQLLNLRSSLKNDISDTLTKNGDTDLLNKYNSIGQDYKKVVAPYLSNTTLRNIVLKKGLSQINPKTIGNLLSKNDTATTSIRNNLSDESKNLLLGTQLKAALKALPKKGILQREADAKSLVNEYGNLDNKGLDFLRTPESIAKIGSIMNDLSRQSKLKWAAGIGIPAVIGAEGARRIF
jgi:DNA-binding HxlR family transcriptional regulator